MWISASTYNDDDPESASHGKLSGNVITARVTDSWYTTYDMTITLLEDTVEVDVTEVEVPEFRRYALTDSTLTRD